MRVGDVYDEIKRSIEIVKPQLLVMGTHGRHGVERWFMGPTTEKLLRHSPVPIVTLSTTGERSLPEPRFRRIVVATDFLDGTTEALKYAFSVAQENESQIMLLHVVDYPTGRYRNSVVKEVRTQLEDLVPAEARNWCDVLTRVESGTSYRVILKMLEKQNADLL